MKLKYNFYFAWKIILTEFYPEFLPSPSKKAHQGVASSSTESCKKRNYFFHTQADIYTEK